MRSFFDRPGLLLTLVTIFWAGNFVLGRAIVGVIPPVTLACLRWTLATLIFLPFAWPHLKRDAAVIRKSWRMLLFLGVIGAGCYNTLSYLGLVSTEALNGLVLSAAGPMFIALTAWGLFGDRLAASTARGACRRLFRRPYHHREGRSFLARGLQVQFRRPPPDRRDDHVEHLHRVSQEAPAHELAKLQHQHLRCAAVANVPLALIEHGLGHSMKANAATAAAIAYVAIFPSLLAYIFYNRGVELLGPARTGLYMFLVPVFGALLAVLFLGERLHLYHALGFAFIIGGVVIGSRRRTVRVAETGSPAE